MSISSCVYGSATPFGIYSVVETYSFVSYTLYLFDYLQSAGLQGQRGIWYVLPEHHDSSTPVGERDHTFPPITMCTLGQVKVIPDLFARASF